MKDACLNKNQTELMIWILKCLLILIYGQKLPIYTWKNVVYVLFTDSRSAMGMINIAVIQAILCGKCRFIWQFCWCKPLKCNCILYLCCKKYQKSLFFMLSRYIFYSHIFPRFDGAWSNSNFGSCSRKCSISNKFEFGF